MGKPTERSIVIPRNKGGAVQPTFAVETATWLKRADAMAAYVAACNGNAKDSGPAWFLSHLLEAKIN